MARGRGRRCAACKRTHDTLLEQPLTSSPAWRKLRAAVVAANPMCAHCGADVSGPTIPGGRADVHHPTPRRDVVAGQAGAIRGSAALARTGEAAAVDAHELVVLCKACHTRESNAERARSPIRGVGSDREQIRQHSRPEASSREKPTNPFDEPLVG
ncbi:MAG: hypothetical protein ACREN2_02190 [Candidatus Dormibacteria bacterium]